MFPILQLGPLAIQTPGLILLAGLWLGLTLAESYSHRFKVQPVDLYNLVFTALISGILGARLTFAVRHPLAFVSSPISLLSLNPDLFDPTGGLVIAIATALMYGSRKHINLWSALDALTPILSTLSVAIGLAHLASGTAFGSQTDLPWGIDLWGVIRHPTQIYEIMAAGIILWFTWPSRMKNLAVGGYFVRFMALSAGARLFLEAFRGDSILLPNGLRVAQLIAWIVLVVSLWGSHRFDRSNKPKNPDLDTVEILPEIH